MRICFHVGANGIQSFLAKCGRTHIEPRARMLAALIGVGVKGLTGRNAILQGLTKGWFPKGWFWRMFPQNEKQNEGTFGCSPGTKTGTRVRSHVPLE